MAWNSGEIWEERTLCVVEQARRLDKSTWGKSAHCVSVHWGKWALGLQKLEGICRDRRLFVQKSQKTHRHSLPGLTLIQICFLTHSYLDRKFRNRDNVRVQPAQVSLWSLRMCAQSSGDAKAGAQLSSPGEEAAWACDGALSAALSRSSGNEGSFECLCDEKASVCFRGWQWQFGSPHMG